MASNTYSLANLIGISVGRLFSKDAEFPNLEEVYPQLFKDQTKIKEVPKLDVKTQRSIAYIKAFAQNFNKRFEAQEETNGC